MKKTTCLVSMVGLLVLGAVGVSSAATFANNGMMYACVNNSTGAMTIVDTATATKPYCGSLSKQTLVAFQTATGMDEVMYGHVSYFGGQTDEGANGYAVFHYQTGKYEIDFNTSSQTFQPTCMATTTTSGAQCKVTSRSLYSVTFDCVTPSVSGTAITYTPTDTDFDFLCVD